MKDLIATLIIMMLCITALARQKTSGNIILPPAPYLNHDDIPGTPLTEDTGKVHFSPPVSIQVLTGSQGLGADVKYGFLPKLTGRLGFSIIPVNAGRGFAFSSFAVQGQFASRFSNIHLLADYAPFHTSPIRLVAGASYLVNGSASAVITPKKGYTIGNQSISSDQIGAINADVTWKGVAPYLGFAVFRNFPNRVFNINLDVGTYYLSSPSTSFTGTKLLSDNEADARQFNQNMHGYHWLPVVQLNFNFRIK